MQLSEDGQYFEITKKVPTNNLFLKSADTMFVENEKMRIKSERIAAAQE